MEPDEAEKMVSARIKELRLLRHMSQRQLAEKIGTQAPYVSDLERCIRSPGVPMLAKLAKALSVHIADLFSENLRIVA